MHIKFLFREIFIVTTKHGLCTVAKSKFQSYLKPTLLLSFFERNSASFFLPSYSRTPSFQRNSGPFFIPAFGRKEELAAPFF